MVTYRAHNSVISGSIPLPAMPSVLWVTRVWPPQRFVGGIYHDVFVHEITNALVAELKRDRFEHVV